MTTPPSSSAVAPRVVAWESTRACAFACRHCRAQAQKNADPNQLTIPEALNLIDQIAELCKPVFIISGGDPLQRPDIFEIAAYASKRGFRVVMSPSGSNITSGIIEKLKASGVRMISLSLDGSTALVHDGFRQVLGAFDLVLRNVSYANGGGLPFRINTTVTQHNVGDLEATHRLAVSLGAKEFDVFMLVPTGRGKISMELSPSQYEETLKTIHNLSLTSSIPVKVTCAPQYVRVALQQKNQTTRAAMGRGCMAGNGFCFVSHVGDVFGCGFLPLAAGNVKLQSFRDIYHNSPLFLELRNPELLRGKCGVCGFKALCGGCRARALSVHRSHLAQEPYCEYLPSNGC
ncbi:MAG: radical SAM protein [Candidatus Bathyarchaeota archaeon]|nr:radical SAM protein [Candidatus Bathyarchaeota archaeon]